MLSPPGSCGSLQEMLRALSHLAQFPCCPPTRISYSLAASRSFPELLGVSQVLWAQVSTITARWGVLARGVGWGMVQQQDGVSPLLAWDRRGCPCCCSVWGTGPSATGHSLVPRSLSGAGQEEGVSFKTSVLGFGGRRSWLFVQERAGSESFPCLLPWWCSLSTNTQKNVQSHSGLLPGVLPLPTYLHSHSLVPVPQGLSHVLFHGTGQPLAPGARHTTLWQLLYLLLSHYSSQPFLMQYIASFIFYFNCNHSLSVYLLFFFFLGLIFSV